MAKKEPTPYETFKASRKAIDKLVDTLYVHQHQAYTTAAEKHLTDAGGEIDYSKLEDVATQDKFAQEMTDFYVTKAKESLGIPKDHVLSKEKTNLLLMQYAGHTRDELLDLIKKYGENFNLQLYKGEIDKVQKNIQGRLLPGATSHVRDEHKASIIREMGLEDRVDATKISTEQLSNLMHHHYQTGGIPETAIKREIYRRPKAA